MLNLPKNIYHSGDILIIKKGSLVRTMHPKHNSYITKRTQKIVVDHTLSYHYVPYYDYERYHKDRFPNAKIVEDADMGVKYHILTGNVVRWAGSGGYWCETEEDNCTLISENKETSSGEQTV